MTLTLAMENKLCAVYSTYNVAFNFGNEIHIVNHSNFKILYVSVYTRTLSGQYKSSKQDET